MKGDQSFRLFFGFILGLGAYVALMLFVVRGRA